MKTSLRQQARKLGKEKCPKDVLREVFRRVDLETGNQDAFYPKGFGQLARVSLFLLFLLMGTWLVFKSDPQAMSSNKAALSQQRESSPTHDAEASLLILGKVIESSGLRSGQKVLEASMPSLRKSFQTIQSTIQPNKPNEV